MNHLGCIDAAGGGRIPVVNGTKIVITILLTALLVVVLFDIENPPPSPTQVADPEVEALYAACYQERDDEIHATAFGTIDNPDVQKEYITTNRARAAAECRALHPESFIAVEEAPRFRLVNFTPRFW